MNKKNLFVDLGHSVKYPGASGAVTEVFWNRAIFEHFPEVLDQTKWNLILVPNIFWGDYSSDINLWRRIKWINARSTIHDFLLSIHGNAASRPEVRGVTTCYMGGSNFARLEAIKMSKDYSAATGVPVWQTGEFDDRNSRFGRLGMVRDTKPFALLIEAGFVTNVLDMGINPANAAKGIATYYNNYN